ncbi:uncharacterized protein LOC135367439 isoform X2 [Ornithodoros turicata]|uniref:uncharacterized protein LOC135367439 isoform X2 n=1 Tax=Ornithodoros turicata TaxID=34597 RepID=UPI0031389973
MERPCHVKGVLRDISSVHEQKVYLLLLARGHYVVPVQFQMPDYVYHLAESLTPGRIYIIFYVSPIVLKLSTTRELILFQSTENTKLQKVSSYQDIEDLLDVEKVSYRLLSYSGGDRLSYYQGVITSIINDECGFYLVNGKNLTLVTAPLACWGHVPRLVVGDHIQVVNCHFVEHPRGTTKIVMCGASHLRLTNRCETRSHETHVFRWMKSLNCASFHFVDWLQSTLLCLTERFVPVYVKHKDIVSYDKDKCGKRRRSLLFTLLRWNAPWLRSRPTRIPVFEFFSQPHECAAVEDQRLLHLEWPSLRTVCTVVKYRGIPFAVAPTWRVAVIPVADLPWQVIGCLGMSKEGTLHLCDETFEIKIRSSIPACSLPLGHIVVIPKGGRFILEGISAMKDIEKRHTLFYLECDRFIPALRAHTFPCPHGLQPPQKAGQGWQTFRVKDVTLPRTVEGRHYFDVMCIFQQQQRVLTFTSLYWLPFLEGGGIFQIQLPRHDRMLLSQTSMPADVAVRFLPDKEASRVAFDMRITSSTERATSVHGVLIDKFYQEARTARAGSHRGPDRWSPCLKVINLETGTLLSIYLNTMTASVPLLGLLPGTLFRLESVRLSQAASTVHYASSTNHTVLHISSHGDALQTYETSNLDLWPAALHPCNGLGYALPLRYIQCVLTKILSLRMWPDCRTCGVPVQQDGQQCTHKLMPTLFLRFEAICDAEVITAICWDIQAKQVLQFNDKLWQMMVDYVLDYKQCIEYSSRGVRDPVDQSGRQVVYIGWTPIEERIARCCKHRSLSSSHLTLTVREMRFAQVLPRKDCVQRQDIPERRDKKKRFHVVCVRDTLGALYHLHQAAVKEASNVHF